MKFAFPLIKLIAGIAVTDCRVDLIQICSFPIHSVILYGIYIRLGLRRIQLNIRKCIEYSANAPPTHSFNLLYILFCVFANIHQQRCFEVYWGVKMAYFLAYYFWLISTTSSLRPLSPQHTQFVLRWKSCIHTGPLRLYRNTCQSGVMLFDRCASLRPNKCTHRNWLCRTLSVPV